MTATSEAPRVEWREGPLPGVRELLIDCPHGTTTATIAGPQPFPDDVLVALAVDRHQAEERCGCALRILPGGQA